MTKTHFDVLGLEIGAYTPEQVRKATQTTFSQLRHISNPELRHQKRNDLIDTCLAIGDSGISEDYAEQVRTEKAMEAEAERKSLSNNPLLNRIALLIMGMGGVVTDFNTFGAARIGKTANIVFKSEPVKESTPIVQSNIK